MRAREASDKSKDEDLLETNTGGTKKVYIEKSEARAKKTRTLEDEDEKTVDDGDHHYVAATRVLSDPTTTAAAS